MKESLMRRAADADVCLLLEGTFPFVRGGVSSWVNRSEERRVGTECQ